MGLWELEIAESPSLDVLMTWFKSIFVIQRCSIEMRASVFLRAGRIAFSRFGSPLSVLTMQQVPPVQESALRLGCITVNMHSSLVCAEDLRVIWGNSLRHPNPGAAGTTGVGVVSSVGHDVVGMRVGDRVLVLDTPGCWASSAEVPIANTILLPRELNLEQAVFLPALLNAWGVLRCCGESTLKSGSVVLNGLGEETPLGRALNIVGSHLGFVVLSDWASARGAALAVTTTAGKTCTDLTRRLGFGGILVAIPGPDDFVADAAGASVPVAASIFNDVSVQGFELAAWVQSNPLDAQKAMSELAAMSGKYSAFDGVRFPLNNFAQAVTIAQMGGAAIIMQPLESV